MPEMSVHRVLVTVLIVLNVTLAVLNFANFNNIGRFIWPSSMVLYDVKPVERMQLYSSTNTNDKGIPAMEPWADAGPAGLTQLQVAKYHLGCYGGPNIDATHRGPWESEATRALWSNDWGNGHLLAPATTYAGFQANKTMTLMQLQEIAGGFAPKSVCMCVDRLLYTKMDQTKIDTLVDDHMLAYYPVVNSVSDPMISFFKKGYGVTNFWVEDDSDKHLETWAATHKEEEYGMYGGTGDVAKVRYKQDIVDFCMTHAVPQLTTTYQGTMDGRILNFCGILLILVSCMREMYYNVKFTPGSHKVITESRVSTMNDLWYGLSFLMAVGASVIFFILHIQSESPSNASNVSFRNENWTSYIISTPSEILYGINLAVILVEIYFIFMRCSRAAKKDGTSAMTQHDHNTYIYSDTHSAIVFTAGWLMIGLGFLIQANVKHVQSVYAVMFLILGACVVQYLSNYFAKFYDMLFKFLDASQGVKLQTESKIESASLKKMKEFFQFIAWGRLLVTITIVFHVIMLISSAKESVSGNVIQTFCENQYIYFSIAFLFANCGFDVMYEILPFVFDKSQAKWFKNYFILLYVSYVNIVLLIYTLNATNSAWDKRVAAASS